MGAPLNPLARDMMVTRLITLTPDMDVLMAIEKLLNHHVAGGPVVDQSGNLVGFLSEKDCMQSLIDAAYDSNPVATVEMCMTREVFSIPEEMDLYSIADIFMRTRYRRLPVVRDGRLVGQISRRDFLASLAQSMSRESPSQPTPTPLYLSMVSSMVPSAVR